MYCNKIIALFLVPALLLLSITSHANITHPDGFIKTNDITKSIGTKMVVLEEPDSAQFVLSLIDGVVINEGGIVTNNGKVLIDTQTSNNDQHKLLKKGRDLNHENPIFFKGKLAVISSPGQENWYHFLLQVLPRLKILKDAKIEFDKIYVNNLRFKFQQDALHHILDILQIPQDKILEINGDVIIQAKTLLVPSVPFIPNKGTAFPKWLGKFIRNSFLNHPLTYQLNKKQLIADKIYVSRAKANIRHISNETEFVNNLESLGFKTVYLEDYTPFEQALLFNNAKIITGPHGSGFVNLIFAKSNTKVIEIDHESEEIRSFYKKFSKIMFCQYYPFYVDYATEEHLENDMYVNIAKFNKYLDNIK